MPEALTPFAMCRESDYMERRSSRVGDPLIVEGVRNTPATWPGREPPALGTPGADRFFALMHRGREILLPRGEFVIGRSRGCDLTLEDMLVSRRHARLLVSRDALFIEDLGSANGIFVNELPAVGAVALGDGDRLMIGSSEILISVTDDITDRPTAPPTQSQVSSRPVPRHLAPMPDPALTERDIPVIRATPRQPPPAPAPAQTPAPMAPPRKSSHPGFEAEDTQRTEKADGLLTMARLADRMLSLGRTDAAVKLLGDNLREVYQKAQAGRAIPDSVRETAALSALKLAAASHDGGWANLAVDLFALLRAPMPAKAIDLLGGATSLSGFDGAKLQHYQAVLRSAAADLSPEHRELAGRIVTLPVR